jgi:hypothetical protein
VVINRVFPVKSNQCLNKLQTQLFFGSSELCDEI